MNAAEPCTICDKPRIGGCKCIEELDRKYSGLFAEAEEELRDLWRREEDYWTARKG